MPSVKIQVVRIQRSFNVVTLKRRKKINDNLTDLCHNDWRGLQKGGAKVSYKL